MKYRWHARAPRSLSGLQDDHRPHHSSRVRPFGRLHDVPVAGSTKASTSDADREFTDGRRSVRISYYRYFTFVSPSKLTYRGSAIPDNTFITFWFAQRNGAKTNETPCNKKRALASGPWYQVPDRVHMHSLNGGFDLNLSSRSIYSGLSNRDTSKTRNCKWLQFSFIFHLERNLTFSLTLTIKNPVKNGITSIRNRVVGSQMIMSCRCDPCVVRAQMCIDWCIYRCRGRILGKIILNLQE